MIKYIYIFMSWVYCADFVPSLFSNTVGDFLMSVLISQNTRQDDFLKAQV